LGSSISFFSEDIYFNLPDELKTRGWVSDTIIKEGMLPGEINYIFCSDAYLLKMNLEHLNHDSFTDIITFNYCEDNVVNSDVFISIDRVKENAETFKCSFENELNRVMIHGVLHLVGYDDKSDDDKQIMRAKEDFYLNLH
jgi:probable rRNA maturation factor